MTNTRRIIIIYELLKTLIEERTAPRWAKVGFLTDLTGWNAEKVRQAREQGLIEYEKRETGFWYNLTSIPDAFIVNKLWVTERAKMLDLLREEGYKAVGI